MLFSKFSLSCWLCPYYVVLEQFRSWLGNLILLFLHRASLYFGSHWQCGLAKFYTTYWSIWIKSVQKRVSSYKKKLVIHRTITFSNDLLLIRTRLAHRKFICEYTTSKGAVHYIKIHCFPNENTNWSSQNILLLYPFRAWLNFVIGEFLLIVVLIA